MFMKLIEGYYIANHSSGMSSYEKKNYAFIQNCNYFRTQNSLYFKIGAQGPDISRKEQKENCPGLMKVKR